MSLSKSFLSLESDYENKCLLCHGTLHEKEKTHSLTDNGWEKLKELSLLWKDIDIQLDDKYYHFRNVYQSICEEEKAFGVVHNTCRVTFRAKAQSYLKRCGNVDTAPQTNEHHAAMATQESSSRALLRRSNSQHLKAKTQCFICEEIRSSDTNSYFEGGLARCSQEKSRNRILERTELFLSMPEHRFNAAARRLKLLQSGQSFDLYSIDVYYHQSCYLKFAVNPLTQKEEEDAAYDERRKQTLADFFKAVRIKILRKKHAFLLHDMLADIKSFSEEQDIAPVINHTVALKRDLIAEFGEDIAFFPSGKYIIVHASNMNPCQYSIATLQGRCLRDDEFVKSFSNFIRLKSRQLAPVENSDFCIQLDADPLPELYNVIYESKYGPDYHVNESGYAITRAKNIATRIWSIASDWQSFITGTKSYKQVVLGQTVHRTTGSKETVMNLHRLGHSVSYNEVLNQNNQWAKLVPINPVGFAKGLVKDLPVHSSIDNNDGRQETVTGAGTTHDTNRTLFQPIIPGKAGKVY